MVVYVTFLRDVACQKLLNLASVSWSYSQNNTGTVFLRHSVLTLLLKRLCVIIFLFYFCYKTSSYLASLWLRCLLLLLLFFRCCFCYVPYYNTFSSINHSVTTTWRPIILVMNLTKSVKVQYLMMTLFYLDQLLWIIYVYPYPVLSFQHRWRVDWIGEQQWVSINMILSVRHWFWLEHRSTCCETLTLLFLKLTSKCIVYLVIPMCFPTIVINLAYLSIHIMINSNY